MILAGCKSGEPVKYTYVFTNTGDRMLDCQLRAAAVRLHHSRRVDQTGEPGKTGSIPIQFNTIGLQRHGRQADHGHLQCHRTSRHWLFFSSKARFISRLMSSRRMAVSTCPPDVENASAGCDHHQQYR